MAHPLNENWLQSVLPPRNKQGHKGSFGTLQIIAGCRRYRGAAALAAGAALRSGAGIVQLAATEPVCAAAAAIYPCCTFLPLPENAAGLINAARAVPLLANSSASVQLAGCGMGAAEETAQIVLALLTAEYTAPLVLDADALNALAGYGYVTSADAELTRAEGLTALAAATRPVILAPHIGEMGRLTGQAAADIMLDPETTAITFARQHHCTVVLKSSRTVIAPPTGDAYMWDSGGNTGLAKGGSGDVLAGLLAGLCAQGIAPDRAAAAAVCLHALAADEAAALYGEAGMTPADLIPALGAVWSRLGR